MIRILIYLILGFVYPSSSVDWNLQDTKISGSTATSKAATTKVKALAKAKPDVKAAAKSKVKSEAKAKNKTPKKEKPQKVVINRIALKKVSFEELPGWNETDIKNSLAAFQNSCKIFLKQAPSHKVGSRFINLQAKDWQPACREATTIDSLSESKAKAFFEKWFHPIELTQNKPVRGLFTGYYMPQLQGSLTRTKKFNTPIYSMPGSRWSNSRRGYTREQIDNGALKKKASIIAWINSPVERLFLEIEGSGVIKLPSGKNIYLGYAGENGAPYTSISGVLINKGIMSRDNASKGAIKRYFNKHPGNTNSILHKNKSFVYFEDLKKPVALGAQDMPLTPGYSLAIDRKWIPLGSPLWLATKKPYNQSEKVKKFRRLVIAQDTGGAIRGLMRGDIYWGAGKKATYLGEHMKSQGRFWLLLPKHIFDRLVKIS